MKIRTLRDAPERELCEALEEFEGAFSYPLGEGRSFRISHGDDYPRFFRAIDAASGASFVAVGRDGGVRGTLGVAVRLLQYPSGECRLAAYLGDLKTAPGVSRGMTLLRLGIDVTAWSKFHGAVVAYGVVMGGTSQEPSAYTGKLGIYPFRKIGEIVVLRLPVDASGVKASPDFAGDEPSVEDCFRALSQGAFAPLGGSPLARSHRAPIGLLAPDRSACGILEDTRGAKRLYEQDGREMLSVHLSRFAWRDPAAGVALIRQALLLAGRLHGAPAMFVSVPAGDAAAFLALLGDMPGVVQAPASVYGTWPDLAADRWHISTAEI